ncbi:MAG: Asp-tRNA(Asn)/Glu-tRNA(Gln) amidotransferase subunit GatC [Pirellulales bacterium]
MLTPAEVERISLLARLSLNPGELEAMARELTQILSYVDQLAQLDLAGVEPMAHAIDVANVFADDEVAPSLPREQALANAPAHDGECYLVPAVLGE